jgi:2,4-dienoyl-CoA reductase-like NADH-dependent reductase (Old Yellow Enzyme family)
MTPESKLFTSLRIGKHTLTNRITVAPMCQYSAIDGSMGDWHLMHLGSLAISGASMLVMEATGVVPEGRITPYCPGLWSDTNEAAMKRVADFVRSVSPVALGVQLAHAGRKASSHRPWQGHGPLAAAEGAWLTAAPSAVPLASGWPAPHEMSRADMQALTAAFARAARRAARIGLDFVELHSTHGYLLSEFLSPLSNRRNDEYGGSLENRMRYPLEVFRAVREAFPVDRFVGAKISGSDFADGGFTPDEAVAYAKALKVEGCDYVTVSGGGVVLDAKIPVGPGYQVPLAARVKNEANIVTGAVGLITEPQQADRIIAGGQADFVSLARAMLFNPRWPQHAAVALGAELPYLPQYERGSPKLWPPGRYLDGRQNR